MRRQNWAPFLKWAVIGGIAAVGVAGLNIAIGQGSGIGRASDADGWKYHAKYDPKVWPAMEFDLTVTNAEEKTRTLDRTVWLIREEFKGNPVSRVFKPGDIENRDLESQRLKVTVPGHSSISVHLAFKTRGEEGPTKTSFGESRISYPIAIEWGGLRVQVGAAVRPRK